MEYELLFRVGETCSAHNFCRDFSLEDGRMLIAPAQFYPYKLV